MTVNPRGAIFWGGALVSLGTIDWVLNQRHDGSTLSEFTRWLFHTDTVPGKVAWTAFVASGSYVLHQHIAKPVVEAIS